MIPDLIATQNVSWRGFAARSERHYHCRPNEVGSHSRISKEVSQALQDASAASWRAHLQHDQPSLYSMSRGTGMRVFTAMPVIVRDSRSRELFMPRARPARFKYLYERRKETDPRGVSMILPTLLIGFLFHRRSPNRSRAGRTHQPGRKGDRDGPTPAQASRHQRIRPAVAKLSRNGATAEYALQLHLDLRHHVSHELKSPLTSIQGAAELLRDDIERRRNHDRQGQAQVSR